MASHVAYGNLINMVDFNNRWVYSGSVTTPPCARKVFWNELSTVYPIKQRHLDQFKMQLDRDYYPENKPSNQDTYRDKTLSQVGNYRMIYPVDDHNVKYVTNNGLSRKDSDSTIEQERQKNREMMEIAIAFISIVLIMLLGLMTLIICRDCFPAKVVDSKDLVEEDESQQLQAQESDKVTDKGQNQK